MLVVASVMSVALSASIFPEEKAEMREVKPIFSDAGISTIASILLISIRQFIVTVSLLGNVFAEERYTLKDICKLFKINI